MSDVAITSNPDGREGIWADAPSQAYLHVIQLAMKCVHVYPRNRLGAIA